MNNPNANTTMKQPSLAAPAVRTIKATVHSQIYETKDYDVFTHLDGNRDINNFHVKGLIKSMKEEYLDTFIIINEHYQIIDGQHRFEAIKELGLPLYYVIRPGYGLSQVHRFNQTVRKWSPDEYMQGYSDLGMTDYVQYRAFKEKYRFNHKENLLLLSGSMAKGASERFNKGLFKVKDYKAACVEAEHIMSIGTYYNNIRRNVFVFAMHSLFKNPNFDIKEFLHKLKKQPTALKDCTDVPNYKELIERIYNYKRKEKVNLRFFNDAVDEAIDE